MSKNLYISIVIIFCALQCNAQNLFNNVYDYGLNLTEGAYSIIEYDNDYYITGSHNYGFGNSASTILKVNESGQQVYYKKFDLSPRNDVSIAGLFKNSKLYCIGSLIDTLENPNVGYNSYLLKINPTTGDSIYFKEMNFGYYDRAVDMIEYKDGFLLLGYIYNNVGTDFNYTFISHIDTLGNVLSYQEYGDGTGYHFAYDFKRTDDGGIIIAGETNDYPVEDQHQLWLMKLDSNLNQLWYYEYGDTAIDVSIRTFNYLEETSDGGFLLACENSALSWPSFTSSLVYKIDSLGIEEWSQDLSYSESTYLSSIRKWNNGTFLVAGNVTNYTNPMPGFEDPRGYLFKLSHDGQTLIWQRYFSKWWGNPFNHDYVHDMILSTDGGILVSGYQIHAMPTWNDAWLIKFDSCGYTTDNPTEALIVVDSIVGYTVYISNLSQEYCTGTFYISNDNGITDSSFVYAYSQWTNGSDPTQMQYTFSDTGNFQITLMATGGDSTSSYTVQFTVEDTTSSITNLKFESNFVKVFPNPTKDYVVIQADLDQANAHAQSLVCAVYTPTGRLTATYSLNPNLYQQRIFVNELANGIYILNFMLDGQSIGNKRLSVVR